MPYFVYTLQASDGKYYTGYTTDLKKRMAKHKNGTGAKFTRAFGFKKLLYFEKCRTRSKTMRREAEIKRLSRKGKKI